MKAYYGETIAMAQEEMSKYTSLIEHDTNVLEHYSTLMEMLGKS